MKFQTIFMKIGKVNDSRIVTGVKRLIKFLGLGSKDVQEVRQLSPFGIDSSPIKDMVAVYSETSIKGESVVLGYFNKSLLADKGDFRTYSMDDNGTVKFYIWQKKNGTCEIGGNVDNMVRYSKLEQAFNQLRSDHNGLVTKHNTLVAEVNVLGASYVAHQHTSTSVGTPTTPGTPPATYTVSTQIEIPSIANISPAKINEIKTL